MSWVSRQSHVVRKPPQPQVLCVDTTVYKGGASTGLSEVIMAAKCLTEQLLLLPLFVEDEVQPIF
jgi:hypothetical protein